MQRATRRQLFGLVVGGGAVLAAAVALSPETFLRWAASLSARPLLFGAVLVGVYLCRPFVLWPISAVSVVVGYVLGFWVGVPVALAGAVLTSLPPFVVARVLRTDDGVFGYLGDAGDRLVATTGALRGVVATRLAPLPADAVAYATGLADVPVRTMLLGTAIGELPWVVAAVLAGHSMHRFVLTGLDAGLSLAVGAAVLAVLLVAGPAYRHVRDGAEPV
jgi:uncharacterized membrane protein YdjX (TVP38/TMEM64 family)